MWNPLGSVAERMGKGLAAGAIGTAAMTVGQRLEMQQRGRAGSTTPAEVAEKVLDVEIPDQPAKEQVSQLVHWGFGTALGVVRAFMPLVGIKGTKATVLHFGLVFGGSLVMLPALDLAPPAPEWGSEELAVSAGHHLVYALATGVAFAVLDA